MDDQTLTMTAARARFRAVVDGAAETGQVTTLTRDGRPVAVIMAYDEYQDMVARRDRPASDPCAPNWRPDGVDPDLTVTVRGQQ